MAARGVAHALQQLLGNSVPPILSTRKGSLYQILSRTPGGGVGKLVHQVRWSEKGIKDCYWQVTQSKFKNEGQRGKAWGVLHWRGRQISQRPERIPGSLKYEWKEGVSSARQSRTSPKRRLPSSIPLSTSS